MRTFHVAWALHLLYNLYWCKNPFLLIIFTSFIDTWWGISLHFWLWESSKTFAWWTSWDFIQLKKSLISLPHKNIVDSVQRFLQKSFLLNNFFFACFVFYFNQFIINQVVLLSQKLVQRIEFVKFAYCFRIILNYYSADLRADLFYYLNRLLFDYLHWLLFYWRMSKNYTLMWFSFN